MKGVRGVQARMGCSVTPQLSPVPLTSDPHPRPLLCSTVCPTPTVRGVTFARQEPRAPSRLPPEACARASGTGDRSLRMVRPYVPLWALEVSSRKHRREHILRGWQPGVGEVTHAVFRAVFNSKGVSGRASLFQVLINKSLGPRNGQLYVFLSLSSNKLISCHISALADEETEVKRHEVASPRPLPVRGGAQGSPHPHPPPPVPETPGAELWEGPPARCPWP